MAPNITRDDLKYWAGLVAAVCTSVAGAVALPHPYDKWVMGVASAMMAISMYNVTPNLPKDK